MSKARVGTLLVVWLLMNFLLALFVVLSYKVTTEFLSDCNAQPNKLCGKTERSARFSAIWLLLVTLCLTVSGILALKRYRTFLTLGMFIGASVIMCNWFLVNAVNYANLVLEKEQAINSAVAVQTGSIQVEFRSIIEGAAAIAAILTVMFALFAGLLVYFRYELVKTDTFDDDEDDIETRRDRAVEMSRRCVVVHSSLKKKESTADSTESEPRVEHEERTNGAVAIV